MAQPIPPVTQVELVTSATTKNDLLCSTCLFYDGVSAHEGLCRRNPPNVPDNAFPKVKLADWCGEHQVVKT